MIDMNRFKNLKDGTLTAAAMIAVGAIFLLLPGTSMKLILRIGAIVLIASGVMQILTLKKNNAILDLTNPAFLRGAAFTALGVIMLALPGLVLKILPFVAGICIIYAGAMQLIPIIKSWKNNPTKDYKQLIVPAVTLIAGVLLIFNPFGSMRMLLRIAGAALIWYGVTTLIQKTNDTTPPPAI